MLFDPAQGVLVCKKCSTDSVGEWTLGGQRGGQLPVGGGALAAMRQIVGAPDEKLFSFSLGESSLPQLSELAERYVAVQLDHTFSSLEIYHQFSAPTV